MTAWLRFVLTVLWSTIKPRLRLDEESSLDLRVWPTDADLTFMNHARYLTAMEQGRIDLMLRTGFLRFLLKQHWSALLGSMIVQFRKPLRRFQRFRLRTRLVHWDDKWVYVEHRIERGDTLIASGLAKNAIIGPEGRLAPRDVLRAFGYSIPAPPGLPMIERFQEGEDLMHDRIQQWPLLEWSMSN
jgi:acyl-CoA thioesterase FadM